MGCCAFDVIARVEEFPHHDRKEFTDTLACDAGGPAATASAAIARLGGRCAFFGAVGEDIFGKYIHEAFVRDGVEPHLKEIPQGSSLISMVWVDGTGRRTIISSRSTLGSLSAKDIPHKMLADACALHLDGHQMEASLGTAEQARELGLTLSLDAGSLRPGMEELLRRCHVVVVSSRFCRELLAGADAHAVKELLSMGPTVAGVTLGDAGCIVGSEEGLFQLPAYPAKVMDSTGAGDAFHGAFLYALIKGDDIPTSARLASAVAALSTRELGGRAGLPTLEEAEGFIAESEELPIKRL